MQLLQLCKFKFENIFFLFDSKSSFNNSRYILGEMGRQDLLVNVSLLDFSLVSIKLVV